MLNDLLVWTCCEEKLPSENDIPNDSKIEQFIKQIRYKLSLDLNKSGLNIADGNQTFFPNGYFDIKSGNFCPCNTVEWFHNFCIPYDYDENASNPDSFDQILSQLFDGDETKIKLAYQIIGALISEVRSLKEIYVFQGVTNSGKTTLASIINKLLDKHERKKLNSMTEITDDALEETIQERQGRVHKGFGTRGVESKFRILFEKLYPKLCITSYVACSVRQKSVHFGHE